MRLNLPVTQHEHLFPAGESLVSTTDDKGRILHCNQAFVDLSGYAREQLLGQPHNLIRHPDMPAEAFRDLWATVQAGRPWTGVVKNRRADGDHYWVRANVTPLWSGGQISGYLSVRTEPSRDEIQAAEALYAAMREDAQRAQPLLRLSGGRLWRDTPAGRLRRRLRLGAAGQLDGANLLALSLSALAGLALAGSGGWAWAGVAAVVGALAGGLSLQRRQLVHAPLQRLQSRVLQLAGCDLSLQSQQATAGSGDAALTRALQRGMDQLAVNLRSVMRDTRREIESMRSSVAEIAHGNQDLSQRTEAQAGSLQQTASSMEEITGTVRSSAEHADQAARRAEAAAQATQLSHSSVGQVVATMDQIGQASQRVVDIVGVIEGIAFQTNLLALNAAVEAARAGEQGRGFAVVAGEVRALAQRSAHAAREIQGLIGTAADRVQAGIAATDKARGSMDQALDVVRQVGQLAGEIARGACEQQQGIAQVNGAVTQMDGITQQNAAMVEQLAATAASLRGQADSVVAAVRLFRLGGDEPLADAVALRRQARVSSADAVA
ncbi:MAG: PAS domain-containing protein [Burkholderiaceae bacterium]|nr:PAS domain-containing protein [Burkholderiaceae bacterium]